MAQYNTMPYYGYTPNPYPPYAPPPGVWGTPGSGADPGGSPYPYSPISSPPYNNPMANFTPDTSTWGDPHTWEGKGAAARTAMLEAYMGLNQQEFDRWRFGQERNDQMNMWAQTNAWNRQNDLFARDLSNRQYGLSEWQAREAANQFGAQFGFEQQKFGKEFGLAERQQAAAESQWGQQFGLEQNKYNTQREQFGQTFGEGQRQFNVSQANEQKWRDVQAQLNRENQANQLTQSRYSAFGRAQAPSARMARSW